MAIPSSVPTDQLPARERSLEYLRSIDASLKALVALARQLLPPAPVDLDGPHGDPIINASDPRDWTGDTMKGRKFSECPPVYLDLWAQRLDYFAEKAAKDNEVTTSGNPREPYLRKDAARARGWAARIRAGYNPAIAASNREYESDFPSDTMKSDEIQF